MSTPFPTNAHKSTPVLDKCSLTFSRKTKALLKKKKLNKTLVLNRMHQNSNLPSCLHFGILQCLMSTVQNWPYGTL